MDNLDRLTAKVGHTLFFDGGDLLKMPRAHFIYTVPIATALAPRNIGDHLRAVLRLPMVKVRSRDEKPFRDGINALIEVVKRADRLDAVFASEKLVPQAGQILRRQHP